MNKIIEYLEDIDILSLEKLEIFIWKSDLQTLIDVAYQIRLLVNENFVYKEYSPFSYVPSGDISGVGGCSEINCKIKRASEFSLFGGLYADNLYLSLNFLTSVHFDTDIDEIYAFEDNFRYMVWCDFAMIITYAALINAGIVQLIPTEKNICLDCFQKKLLGLEKPVDLTGLLNFYIEKAELEIIEYEPAIKRISISVKNMDDFFPLHTETVSFTNNFVSLLKKGERRIGSLVKNEKFKKEVINDILFGELSEVCLNSLCCKNLESKFITDKPSDGILIEILITYIVPVFLK